MALIHGIDASNFQVPLLVDATGKAIVTGTISADLNAGTNNIGDVDIVSAPTLTVQGTNSDKLASIGSSFNSFTGSGDLSAGTNTIDILTPAAGHMLHVGTLAFVYTGTVANVYLLVYILSAGNSIVLHFQQNITSAMWYINVVDAFINSAETLKFQVANATLHDSAFIATAGNLFHTT